MADRASPGKRKTLFKEKGKSEKAKGRISAPVCSEQLSPLGGKSRVLGKGGYFEL